MLKYRVGKSKPKSLLYRFDPLADNATKLEAVRITEAIEPWRALSVEVGDMDSGLWDSDYFLSTNHLRVIRAFEHKIGTKEIAIDSAVLLDDGRAKKVWMHLAYCTSTGEYREREIGPAVVAGDLLADFGAYMVPPQPEYTYVICRLHGRQRELLYMVVPNSHPRTQVAVIEPQFGETQPWRPIELQHGDLLLGANHELVLRAMFPKTRVRIERTIVLDKDRAGDVQRGLGRYDVEGRWIPYDVTPEMQRATMKRLAARECKEPARKDAPKHQVNRHYDVVQTAVPAQRGQS